MVVLHMSCTSTLTFENVCQVQRNPLRVHYNGAGGLLEQMDYKFP